MNPLEQLTYDMINGIGQLFLIGNIIFWSFMLIIYIATKIDQFFGGK